MATRFQKQAWDIASDFLAYAEPEGNSIVIKVDPSSWTKHTWNIFERSLENGYIDAGSKLSRFIYQVVRSFGVPLPYFKSSVYGDRLVFVDRAPLEGLVSAIIAVQRIEFPNSWFVRDEGWRNGWVPVGRITDDQRRELMANNLKHSTATRNELKQILKRLRTLEPFTVTLPIGLDEGGQDVSE